MVKLCNGFVKIQGTRPLLINHFGLHSLPLEKQERTGVAGNDPEEWKRSAMLTKDQQFFLIPTYIFGCLREAAKYTKKGKGSIQKDVAATLMVVSDRILVEDRFLPKNPELIEWGTVPEADLPPTYVDISAVVNPNTRNRNIRYRTACSSGWQCSFHIQWDLTIVSRHQMESVCIDAGRLIGLGDGRGIGFGRFEVLSFEVNESDGKIT